MKRKPLFLKRNSTREACMEWYSVNGCASSINIVEVTMSGLISFLYIALEMDKWRQ